MPTALASMCWGNWKKQNRWFVVGVVGCVVSLGVMFLAAMEGHKFPAQRAQCQNNFKNITLALLQYEAAKGKFPPAYIADASGKPIHSWRVLILPYLEKVDLYERYRFDEPWDGPNNCKLHSEIMTLYSCPSNDPKRPKTETSYVAVVGSPTMWPGAKRVSLGDVTSGDGGTNTILLVEVHNSGIHWMEPRDLDFSQMPMVINPSRGTGISSSHMGGAHVVFASGNVKHLDNDTPSETLRALLTMKRGEEVKQP